MSKVLAVGVATFDTIVLVDRYPEADERVIAKETIQGFGGPATTAAVTMARLGIDVALACVIGDDEAGRKIFDNLKREGIDTRHVVIDPKVKTAIGTIVVAEATQSRAILAQPHSQTAHKPANINDYSWVHVDHLGMAALKEWGVKRGAGPKLSIDIGYAYPGLKSSDFDLYAPSENITKDTSSASRDGNLVVISKGSSGSIYSNGLESGEVPALKGEILSTLGAGDVFHGALVAAQVWGKGARESVELANVVAGLSCRAIDGQSGIPTKAELDAFFAGVRS
ncbi:MAG: carbohydrate kinase family protein [Candidatus Nanopelagicaceae bacterium]